MFAAGIGLSAATMLAYLRVFEAGFVYDDDVYLLPNTHVTAGISREGVWYARALRLRPGYVEAHYNLGWTPERLGRVGEAIDSYRRALAIDPGFSRARAALDRLKRPVAPPGDVKSSVSWRKGYPPRR